MAQGGPLRGPATPAELALHRNFLASVTTAKRGLLRASFYLAEIVDRKVHKVLGHPDGVAYATAAAGLTARQAQDLLRMGRKLRAAPDLANAVANGSLSWGKARLLAGKVDREDFPALLDLAQSRTERELKSALRQTPHPPQPPPTPPQANPPARPPVNRPAAERPAAPRAAPTPRTGSAEPGKTAPPPARHVVSLSFDAEAYARWEAAVAALRRSGCREPLAELHLGALENRGAGEGGGASPPQYLIVLMECPECGAAALNTSRGELPAPRALLETARCDAVLEHESARRRAVIPPRLRRLVLRRARYRCSAAGCGRTRHLQIHHRVPVAAGGATEAENLVVLCARCHRALHERERAMRQARPSV